MNETEASLWKRLISIADASHDGHLTIMKFTRGWRIGFGTPSDRHDIEKMSHSPIFALAAEGAIERDFAYAVQCVLSDETASEVMQAAQAEGMDAIEYVATAINNAVTKSLSAYNIHGKQNAH